MKKLFAILILPLCVSVGIMMRLPTGGTGAEREA